MDSQPLLIIIVLVLLLGGGGHPLSSVNTIIPLTMEASTAQARLRARASAALAMCDASCWPDRLSRTHLEQVK